MKITSEKTLINVSQSGLFTYLADMNNYKELMPEQVINWSSDDRSCRFTIKGMTELGMRILELDPDSRIIIHSDGVVPFQFDLTVEIVKAGESSSELMMFLNAPNLNPAFTMIAKRPLTNLLNYMAGKTAEHFE